MAGLKISQTHEISCLVLYEKLIRWVFLLVQLHHAGEGELKPEGKK